MRKDWEKDTVDKFQMYNVPSAFESQALSIYKQLSMNQKNWLDSKQDLLSEAKLPGSMTLFAFPMFRR